MSAYYYYVTNILVVGSGGREHALGWKLSKCDGVDKVYFAPGNGGTHVNVNIPINNIDKLLKFALIHDCFTIVGPELPLELGIVNEFKKKNLKIFGPTRLATRIESSKIWSKKFMTKHNIPTAKFEIFDNYEYAMQYVQSTHHPIVIKTDGLASGKGVFICNDISKSSSVLNKMLQQKKFGNAGTKIVIEEYLHGNELSYIVLSDGDHMIPLVTSKDYKRIYDQDEGDNTGGMGSYSPANIDERIEKKLNQIMLRVIWSMKKMGRPFVGFLYAGVILHDDDPYVLEFNARMGDPECQSIMMRLNSNLYDYLNACVNKKLSIMPQLDWKQKHAVCVVLASDGYPNNYNTNETIYGLNSINDPDCFIFHAGTKKINKKFVTNGGRVLGVTGLGQNRKLAASKAYDLVNHINWKSKYNRTDIGN
ncbi:MAG: phosphoribosylamine--glycine ligase [Thaumarchaeota archaeon]|nr:phosphoribosylamine--glycine ligase [Nitrososphaerota archaeon]